MSYVPLDRIMYEYKHVVGLVGLPVDDGGGIPKWLDKENKKS